VLPRVWSVSLGYRGFDAFREGFEQPRDFDKLTLQVIASSVPKVGSKYQKVAHLLQGTLGDVEKPDLLRTIPPFESFSNVCRDRDRRPAGL
jgi:hypothetical protein